MALLADFALKVRSDREKEIVKKLRERAIGQLEIAERLGDLKAARDFRDRGDFATQLADEIERGE